MTPEPHDQNPPRSEKNRDLNAMVADTAQAVAREEVSTDKAGARGPVVATAAAVVASLALIAVLAMQWRHLVAPKPDTLTVGIGMARAMVMSRDRVFAYWDSTGRLPESLSIVGPPQPALEYIRTDSSFQFTFTRLSDGKPATLEFTRAKRSPTRIR